MFNSQYIDEIFVDLFDVIQNDIHNYHSMFQHNDRSAMHSFNTTLTKGQALTESQANYVIKLLTKYRKVLTPIFDYRDLLDSPKWSKPFRIVDLTRRIWVELEQKKVTLVLKFPYSVKESFDEEIVNTNSDNRIYSQWDPERKVRQVNPYDVNILKLNNWLEEHNFEIDDSYENFTASVDEILNNEDEIIPYSIIENNSVHLVNAIPSAQEYFENNKTSNIDNDLLLAKLMGFQFIGKDDTIAKKISSSASTKFRIPDIGRAIDFSESIQGTKVIILDRASDYKEWLLKFHTFLINHNIDVNKFVLCHRENNKTNPNFNQWVKDSGFGGKTDSAEYLIFLHRPKKWLFSSETDVKIVFTTGLWDSRDNITRSFVDSIGCDISISEAKPTNVEDSYPFEFRNNWSNRKRVEL